MEGGLEFSYLTMGPCQTVEAIKPTGANGEGRVEFAGVFHLHPSDSAGGVGALLHLQEP